MADHPDNAPTDLLADLNPEWLVIGATIEEQQGWRGTVVKTRGSLDLLDCALIEWDRTGGQQWVAHKELRLPRLSPELTYEWYRNAVEHQIADQKPYLPRESLLDAEQLAWIRAFGSSELRQQLQQGMDYRVVDKFMSEWVELHHNELGTKQQGDIYKRRCPGFVLPHHVVVVADKKRFGHVKPVFCRDVSIDLCSLTDRAAWDHRERNADGLTDLAVQPTAFLGIRTDYRGHSHADFLVHDPKNPARSQWLNSVSLRDYSSPADEQRAVSEMRKLAMPAKHAELLREQIARREVANANFQLTYENVYKVAQRVALQAELARLTTDVKTRHSETVSRLLGVAENARQQPQSVQDTQNTRGRGR